MLYSGSLISGAFSGLISAGITDGMDGKRGLLAWCAPFSSHHPTESLD
jgi:hypothetical protein